MTLNDIEIGSLVKAVRGEMSQAELAERMRKAGFKWSQAAVWSTERGERYLKLSEAVELCEIFAVTPHVFLGYDTSAAMTAIIRDAALGQAIRRVVRDEVAP